MTIKDLIIRLQEYPQDAEVLLVDVESLELVTITGFLYNHVKNELELCTDDNS